MRLAPAQAVYADDEEGSESARSQLAQLGGLVPAEEEDLEQTAAGAIEPVPEPYPEPSPLPVPVPVPEPTPEPSEPPGPAIVPEPSPAPSPPPQGE